MNAPMSLYRRLPAAVPIAQAIDGAPALARLAGLVDQSVAMLHAVRPLIPPTLKVHAGPVQEEQWCLLVDNSAAASKLRQLLPLLQGRLRQQGWPIEQIRVKIMAAGRR
jgi:hypothetical protein